MFPNTAIFYDVENFLSENYFELSLSFFSRLIDEIKKVPEVKGVAIQRAYANFCSASSEKLRNAILYAGIEPVQIYSLSKNQNSKNIADIQISIDIDELIYTNKNIDVFVIVSGDAGFSIIAKRIHQNGKILIGCARRIITADLFIASCEKFIFIENGENKNELSIVKGEDIESLAMPLAIAHEEKPVNQEKEKKADKPEILGLPKKNAFLKKVADYVIEKYVPLKKSATIDEVKAFIYDVAEFINSDTADRKYLIQASVLSSLLRYYDPKFDLKRLGYVKFNKFLVDMCSGSGYCIKTPDDCDFLALCIADESDMAAIKLDEELAKAREQKKQAKIALIKENIKKKKKNTVAEEASDNTADRVVKVGEYVRASFIKLVENDVLMPEEVEKLKQKEYSKATFGISYPALKEIDTNESITPQLLVGKTCRYWSLILLIEGKSYVLCSAWYEKYRQAFEKWIKELG